MAKARPSNATTAPAIKRTGRSQPWNGEVANACCLCAGAGVGDGTMSVSGGVLPALTRAITVDSMPGTGVGSSGTELGTTIMTPTMCGACVDVWYSCSPGTLKVTIHCFPGAIIGEENEPSSATIP